MAKRVPNDHSGSPLYLPSRRTIITGATAAVLLAGCGDSDSTSDGAAATTAAAANTTGGAATGTDAVSAAGQPVGLLAYFDSNTYVQAGTPQRIVFAMIDQEGVVLENPPATATFTVIQEKDGQGVVVAAPTEEPVRQGNLPRPYFSVRFTAEETGLYQVGTNIDGVNLSLPFQVVESAPHPQIGQVIEPLTTPTVADGLEVDPICTQIPPCELHETSLDDGFATGKPVVMLISTPRFCQVSVCGPVLNNLVEAAPNHPDKVFIHQEVFTDLETTTLTDTVQTLGYAFEPSLLVMDADGTLVERLDNTWDADEQEAALALL